jgi:DNA-binding winged helix-turn-helix (wHTH) protein/Tfp pilus assembly protein PilF
MNQQPVYRFDGFVVDPEAWRLSRAGQEVHLDPVVLKLLIYLIANNDRLVTRQELMDTVWGDTVISESALTKAVARLRKALGDDSATHRYLETVRSQGYRFVASVEEEGVHSLAVLPLKNLTGDPEQGCYVDGLHDLLITELYRLPGLAVTSRQSTIRYRDSRLSMNDIAVELGVDALVEGSLLRKGATIEVTIQLIDGRSDKHLWAERYMPETSGILNMTEAMASAIGVEIGVAMASPRGDGPVSNRVNQVDPRAIDAYAMGTAHLEQLSRNGLRTAIGQLEMAVAIEPKFAQAWAQLAAAYAMEGLFGFSPPRDAIAMARDAALKAVEANEQFYGGHSALGWARLWTGDIEGACELFKEALRLNPSAPAAIHGEADCLMFDGRVDESLVRLRELVTISPFSVIDNIPLPTHLYMARRYDEAIIEAKAMQARLPQVSMHRFFSRVYWQQGLFHKAVEEERLELERRGDFVLLEALEEGFSTSGPTGAMLAMGEALVAQAEKSYVEPFNIAGAFARAGSFDKAMHWLERAVENGSYEMHYIAFWPHVDFMRDTERYQHLVTQVYGHKAQAIRRLQDNLL